MVQFVRCPVDRDRLPYIHAGVVEVGHYSRSARPYVQPAELFRSLHRSRYGAQQLRDEMSSEELMEYIPAANGRMWRSNTSVVVYGETSHPNHTLKMSRECGKELQILAIFWLIFSLILFLLKLSEVQPLIIIMSCLLPMSLFNSQGFNLHLHYVDSSLSFRQ